MYVEGISRWNSEKQYDAYYFVRRSDGTKLCQTDGWNFFSRLQDILSGYFRLDRIPRPAVYTVSIGNFSAQFSPNEALVDPPTISDALLLASLYYLRNSLQAPLPLQEALARSVANRVFGLDALKALIWLVEAVDSAERLAPDAIALPDRVELPVYGARIDFHPEVIIPGAGRVCRMAPRRETRVESSAGWVVFVVLAFATAGAMLATKVPIKR